MSSPNKHTLAAVVQRKFGKDSPLVSLTVLMLLYSMELCPENIGNRGVAWSEIGGGEMGNVNRRQLLAGCLAAPLALPQADCAGVAGDKPRAKTLDIHVHLAGTGDSGSGCRMSSELTRGLLFKLLLRKLRIRRRASTFDEGYVLALADYLSTSCLDKAAILGFDAVYDGNGKPDWHNTHFYVPNDYVFEVAGRYPQWMVPCVSINPDRADAIDELERCVERGSRGLKILAPSQGVDLAQKKHTRFFQRCAELKVVLIIHTGHEHAIPVLDNRLGHPRKLELALDQGCTVVACHCGTSHPGEKPEMLPDYLAMIREYPNLWGDTAALTTRGRRLDFRHLRSDRLAIERFVHGSDFPVPPMAIPFVRELGLVNTARLRRIRNPFSKDLAIKNALGVGRTSAERACQLLCA